MKVGGDTEKMIHCYYFSEIRRRLEKVVKSSLIADMLFCLSRTLLTTYPAQNIYLFKVNNKNTKRRCEIRSKLTIKTPERRQ